MDIKELENCKICPRNCRVDRTKNIGYCKCNDKIKIALVSTHYYEEPCISMENGSGTIFFSNCNMNCMFCQNYEISQLGKGKEVSIERLADIMIEQQKRGVNNINLVTPTMYVYQIIEAIKIARKNGLSIPIVYNTNSYENIETIKALKGYVDIYLPDMKYYTNSLSVRYSKAPNYFEKATKAILEMKKQIPNYEFDKKGIMKKGIIIRHLILPTFMQNSKNILKWIKENFDDDIYVSVMAQYFPTYKAKEDDKINRKISAKEYREIEKYVYELNFKNGYIQDLGKHEEEYVPNFNFDNV